ncbi:MAG: MFS transporter [bacterium]
MANDAGRLTLFQKITFSTGECANSILNISFVLWSMFFYAPPQDERHMAPLIPVLLAGAAMSVGKVVDAVTDPLVAYWSDRCGSRWGRRKPFIAVSAPLLFLVFVLLWTPPVREESLVNLAYLAFMVSAFWSLFTAVRIPYVSLIPEIAVTSEERVNLSAWIAVMMIAGNAAGMLGSSYLVGRFSFPVMGAACGAVCLVCWYTSISFVREKKFETSDFGKFNLYKAVATTLRNKPFLVFLYAFFSFQLGFNLLTGGMAYIVRVILGMSSGAVGTIFLACFASVLAFTPVVTALAKRFGKKKIFSVSIFMISVFLCFTFFVGRDYVPSTVQTQIYVLMALMGFPVAGFFILPNAITADIVDHDEKATGLRREAIYYGMSGFVWKLAIAFSATLMGWLFHGYGYASQCDMGIRFLGPVSSLFIFISFLVFQFYTLGEEVSGSETD